MDRPPIVLILSADHGVADAGCYGSPDVAPPHIDRLAEQGVRLDRIYTPNAMCAPGAARPQTGTGTPRWITM